MTINFTVTNPVVRGVGQDFSHAVISFVRLVYEPFKSERFTAQICIKVRIYIFHSVIPSSFIYQEKSSTPKLIHRVKMPRLNNSESRQVTHDSQGLRVTVRIADDSTSANYNTADDSTSAPTNNNNYADDLTSTINSADYLTSASPTVVPIGRGGRLARPNNVSNPSPVGRGVGRGGFGRNASNNLFVVRGVGRNQPIQTNAQPSTSAPRVGREVGCSAGRGGRYFHPYRRPAVQTSASTINGTHSSSVIFLDSDGEEVEEEEENFVGSNDDHRRFSCIEHLFKRRRLIFDINERYAESLIQQEIRALERENLWLQNECQRLNAQLRRCMNLLTS